MRHLNIELLGLPLIHIEWGRDLDEPDEVRDTQYPMTIGFASPEHVDEIHVRPEL